MSNGGLHPDVSRAVGVIGALAFAAGLTKAWIISPLGDAFGDMSADGKVIVVALLVGLTIAAVATARVRRRRLVDDAARRIASHPSP
jgi:hypothetical protein